MGLLSAFAADMEINVVDPAIRFVELDCSGERFRAPVVDQKAVFVQVLGECTVHVIAKVGQVNGNEKYTCGPTGCARNGIEFRQVSYDPNRLVIVLSDKSTTLMELVCPGGYRQRAEVSQNTVVFDNLPYGQECNLFWKLGSPAQAKNLRPGRYFCRNQTGTGICESR